jgi:hypothetical protein
MIPSTAQLQIDIYITNAAPQGYSSTTYHAGAYGDSEFAPPRPSYAQGDMKRSDSVDSMGSMMSGDPRDSMVSTRGNFDYADEEMAHAGGNIMDYTNYEDETDVNDPAESELSRQIQKQGKLRRAKTRKAEARHRPSDSGHYAGSSVYPPSPGNRHSRHGSSSSSPGLPPGAGYYGEVGGERGGLLAQPVVDPKRRSLSAGAYEFRDRDSLMLPDANQNPKRVSGRSVSSSLYETHQGLLAAGASDPRRHSYRSVSSSMYDRYDPYNSDRISPSPSGLFDRDEVSVLSRTQSMVFLEDAGDEPLMAADGLRGSVGLWIDEADYAATSILSESARAGRPKLSQMIDDELGLAEGSIIVGTCGPVKLNVVVRNLVSRNIRPGRILKGDKRGHVAVFSEDFEM